MKNYFLNADFRTGTVSKSYGVTSGVLAEADELLPEWTSVVAISGSIITGDVLVTNPLVGADATVPAPPVGLQAKRMLRFDIANDFNPAQDDFSAAAAISQTITDIVPVVTGRPIDLSFWVYSQGGGQIRLGVTKAIYRTAPASTTIINEIITVDPGWTQVRRGIYLNHEVPNHPELGILSSTSMTVSLNVEQYSATTNQHTAALKEHVVLCLTGFCLGEAASSFTAADELDRERVLPNPSAYRALLTQTGTAVPTAVALENSLGLFDWTRTGVGTYRLSASTPVFTANKTFILIGPSEDSQVLTSFDLVSTSVIDITTRNVAGAATDALLKGTAVEILVYP